MSQQLMQYAYLGIFFLLPGMVGAWLARTKGRNPVFWFIINSLFPPTLMITIFQGPTRPVQGHYRRCPRCAAYSKWRDSSCRFCQTELTI